MSKITAEIASLRRIARRHCFPQDSQIPKEFSAYPEFFLASKDYRPIGRCIGCSGRVLLYDKGTVRKHETQLETDGCLHRGNFPKRGLDARCPVCLGTFMVIDYSARIVGHNAELRRADTGTVHFVRCPASWAHIVRKDE